MSLNIIAFQVFAYENRLSDLKPDLPMVHLPSDFTSTWQSAMGLMEILAPKKGLFTQSGGVVCVSYEKGVPVLAKVDAFGLRSIADKHITFMVKKANKAGEPVAKPSSISAEDARAIIACRDAVRLLPVINGMANFPLMRSDGTIAPKGYDERTGILGTGNVRINEVPLERAVTLLRNLLRDFKFASPADESRAVSAILAPMLRLGVWQGEMAVFPIFTIEANESQSGKGWLTKVITAIYNETPTMVAQPKNGVGSLDESFNKALLRGRPIVVLDNLRNKVDSQVLESFTTAAGPAYARALRTDGEADSRYYILYATSNGFDSTKDLANRMCMIRIEKQPPDYEWYPWREGGILNHVKVNRADYLGAIRSVLREWIGGGMPTAPCQHDQREWASAMNWIVQNIFHLPPLMDGHAELKQRVANPAMGFLRAVALSIKVPEVTLTASEIVSIVTREGIDIPNDKGTGDDEGKARLVGIILGTCFKTQNEFVIDGVTITRTDKDVRRDDGNGFFSKKTYTFRRGAQAQGAEVPDMPAVPPTIRKSNFNNIPDRVRLPPVPPMSNSAPQQQPQQPQQEPL